MSGEHLDKLLAILEKQTDMKLDPHVLFGYLGLMNLMSIMSFVHSAEGGQLQLPVESSPKLNQVADNLKVEDNNLMQALTSLMPKDNQKLGGMDLSSLMNMVGDKKINPQMIMTLMNLLNSTNKKSQTDNNDNNNKKEVKEVEQIKDKSKIKSGLIKNRN